MLFFCFMLHASCFSRNPLPLTLHTEQFVLWPYRFPTRSQYNRSNTSPIHTVYTLYMQSIYALYVNFRAFFVPSVRIQYMPEDPLSASPVEDSG